MNHAVNFPLPWRLRRLITLILLAALPLGSAASGAKQSSIPIPFPLGEGIAINAGLAGSWANEAIPGQGIFVDVDPANRVVFMAWFTYGDADPDAEFVVGHPTNRWYVAVGNYAAGSNSVVMTLSETEGGVFDDPAEVIETEIGSLTLSFESCTEAGMDFEFNDELGAGHIELTRLTPASTCESLLAR